MCASQMGLIETSSLGFMLANDYSPSRSLCLSLSLCALPADFGILLRFFMLTDSTKWTRAIWDRHGVSLLDFTRSSLVM